MDASVEFIESTSDISYTITMQFFSSIKTAMRLQFILPTVLPRFETLNSVDQFSQSLID